jgi:hypothetical protein
MSARRRITMNTEYAITRGERLRDRRYAGSRRARRTQLKKDISTSTRKIIFFPEMNGKKSPDPPSQLSTSNGDPSATCSAMKGIRIRHTHIVFLKIVFIKTYCVRNN